MPTSKQKVFFPGSQNVKLAAALEKPAGAARAFVLFAHCFTCTKDIFSARYLTAGLVDNGFAVLRFDFTGLGASEGDFSNTNFSSNVGDLICAADFLRAQFSAPSLIVGHSLGGAAVLAAANKIPEIKAVATIGAPAEPAHVRHLFTDQLAQIEKDGSAEVRLAGYPFRIKKQFLDDIEEVKLSREIASLNKALLIFHSVVDKTVGVENARKIYEAAKHPKSFISLANADHLLTDKRDAIYVSDVLVAWAQRYLPAAMPVADEISDDVVRVAESGSGLSQKIYNGKHELVADEPSTLGGANTGPTPYGYLLAALGACTTMTLRMYADRKNIPLARASVAVRHQKVHAEDCQSCDDSALADSAKVEQIVREITLEGELSEEQKTKLLAIADKCPVHRTLHSNVDVVTKLKK